MKVTLCRKQTPHEGVAAKTCCNGMGEIAQGGAVAAARGQMGDGAGDRRLARSSCKAHTTRPCDTLRSACPCWYPSPIRIL